ncbi:hypothetical protein [Thiolapillus sp.]
MTSELIAFISFLVAGLSALYARWAVKEAKKSNDIGRLNSLLSLRIHYLQLMENQHKLAKLMPNNSKGMELARNTYADLDTKLREVHSQIDFYHRKVVENKL